MIFTADYLQHSFNDNRVKLPAKLTFASLGGATCACTSPKGPDFHYNKQSFQNAATSRVGSPPRNHDPPLGNPRSVAY